MKPNKLMGLMAVSMIFPVAIITADQAVFANGISVKTPRVEALTRKDSSIYVNTNTTIQLPSRSTYRYRHLPRRNRTIVDSNCRYTSHQTTSHTTRSNSSIIQSTVTSNSCN
ncbi:hypothetical protein NIES4102_32870 [Chondrocystis sp. NIES-4102]|nr:hypothetical protein NIES4102_32870 [Chondrocystis sp. NIES-4102]